MTEPTIEICDSSPAAKDLAAKASSGGLYPFDKLQVGQSFKLNLEGCNWKSLRTIVYKRNASERKAEAASVRNETAKEFAFIKHDALGVVEVARIK